MKTITAIDKIRNGGFIMCEFDPDDQKLKWRCIPGGGLSPTQAKTIIKELKLKPQNDMLFPDAPPQSWRLDAA